MHNRYKKRHGAFATVITLFALVALAFGIGVASPPETDVGANANGLVYEAPPANDTTAAEGIQITALTPNGQGQGQGHLATIRAQLTAARPAVTATFGNGHVEAVSPPIQVPITATVTGDSHNSSVANQNNVATIKAPNGKGVDDVVFPNSANQQTIINNDIATTVSATANSNQSEHLNTTATSTTLEPNYNGGATGHVLNLPTTATAALDTGATNCTS